MTIDTSSFNVFIEEGMLQISHIDDHRRDQSSSPLTWESHHAHTIPITCCFIKTCIHDLTRTFVGHSGTICLVNLGDFEQAISRGYKLCIP